ncbi:MAG: VOC family protein [Saprospiraceae bacterium]
MEVLNSAISWFEIPVLDFPRAQKFYQAIFDTQIEEMQMGPFRMGMFPYDRDNNGVGGAICHSEGYKPAGGDGVKVYLNGGDDLNTVLNRVAGAGGSIVMPKTEIAPGMGNMAFFNDTEGNVVGLFSMG